MVAGPIPNAEIQETLLILYHRRVDCLYKILHWPTVLMDIKRLHDGVDVAGEDLASVRSLEASIHFMALCTINDDEAILLGISNRGLLVQHYRDATERAILEAGLYRHPTLPSLQAFVIYLVCTSQHFLLNMF
jgi:hypothetical protein